MNETVICSISGNAVFYIESYFCSLKAFVYSAADQEDKIMIAVYNSITQMSDVGDSPLLIVRKFLT